MQLSRSLKRLGLVALGLAVAVVSQIIKLRDYHTPLPFALDLAAVLLLALALPRRDAVPPPAAPASSPRRLVFWGGAVLALAGGAVSILCTWWLVESWDALLFRVLAVGPPALLALGLGLDLTAGYGDRWRPRLARAAGLLRRRDLQLLAAILAVGFIYRFATLGTFPPPTGFSSVEETQRGTAGWMILRYGMRPWEWPLPQYLAAASFHLFGYSMNALRVPVMVLGWLTLIVFYLLAREIAETPAALLATALLAVSRWHVQVSWYNEDVYAPLFPFTIVLYLLLRTRDEPRPSYYVALGALCGYTLYDYAGYRGTALISLLFLTAHGLWTRRTAAEWRRILLFTAVLALFVPPLVHLLQRGGVEAYTEAMGRSLDNTTYYTSDPLHFIQLRLERIRDSADAFTRWDHGAFFPSLNIQVKPLLDPFTGVLFVLGLGTTLLRFRQKHHLFFGLTFLFLALMSTTVVQSLDFRRLAMLIPFTFAFTALIAQKLGDLAAEYGRTRPFRLLLVLVALSAGAWNYNFLFRELAGSRSVRAWHRNEYTVAAFYLKDHYRGEYIYFLTPILTNFFTHNDYDWIKPRWLQGRILTHPDQALPFRILPPPNRDVLLLIERPYTNLRMLRDVEKLYTGSSCEMLRDPDDRRWDLAVCHIPADSIPRPERTSAPAEAHH